MAVLAVAGAALLGLSLTLPWWNLQSTPVITQGLTMTGTTSFPSQDVGPTGTIAVLIGIAILTTLSILIGRLQMTRPLFVLRVVCLAVAWLGIELAPPPYDANFAAGSSNEVGSLVAFVGLSLGLVALGLSVFGSRQHSQ